MFSTFRHRSGILTMFSCAADFVLHGVLRGIAVAMLFLLTGCGIFQFGSEDVSPKAAHQVVSTAYTQLGKRYAYGGASPKAGFDCSGLIFWAYRKHGFKVPRITTDQARYGKKVAKNQIREGDILVFKIPESPRNLHTALYAGKQQFIHSPGKGKRVKVDSVQKEYWKKRLVAVRRVVR